ncbi:cGMP-dependent 3',5'-cyclic phosphodiesterase-like isoform X4 [Amphiura filiformis]|uniref:cGMP-dependent 3',5'-cyclic phosphodiesterase-like isoform X4 n=1 Tax=Amphiura filiformis TaxID=82378 RepID=UPI003B2186B4
MAQESLSEEAVQEALLRLTGVTDFNSLREAIRDAVGCTLPGLGDLVIYIQDLSSGVDLISTDGLAGAQHILPKTGIAGKCLDKRNRLLVNGLSADDPLSGLLSNSSSPLPANKKVLCSPVIDKENQRIVCVMVAVCDNPSSAHEKCFSLLEKHVAVCVHRLQQQGHNNNRPRESVSATARKSSSSSTTAASFSAPSTASVTKASSTTSLQAGDTTHRPKDEILALCADLHDDSASSMQVKVIKFLESHTQSECCTLLVVSEESSELFCQVLGNKVLEEEIRFMTGEPVCKYEIPCCCFNKVLTSKKSMMLKDIDQSDRQELTKKLGITIRSMLCVPVINYATNHVVAVACAINKLRGQSYSQRDEDVIQHCFRYTVPVLTSVLALQKETRLKQETQSMLQVAKNLFTHLDDVRILLREIMQEARNLTQAERCSLFLVENDELVAKVFDGHVLDGEKPNQQMEMGEVRIPITQGIAGHVATTGKILNILDAYSHPLFYRGVDDSTGFRTRNILCFPIKDRSTVVGIAELCNKSNGMYFTKHDEEVAAAFSIYCGISIVHSLLCKKMKDAQYRSKLANELMMYHMKVGEDDAHAYKKVVPKTESFHPEFAKFSYSPRGIPESDTISAVITMFDDMGMIQRWRINKNTLAQFIVLVKRGYRDPPYHNWYHAFSVGHFCYLLYKNISKLNMLDDIEVFSLFVAAICHDLDHRGTNNSFQVHSQSVLAALYSSEGSVMERHHFAQAMCILNTEGCNIFENLSREDYQMALDLVQDIILATDLAHHLRIVKDLRKMAREGYDAKDPKCHKLLLCLLMTSADLSDQTKGWQTTKKIAELIYREFFSQGDLEKAMGLQTPEMYDREKACIPELQINFLDHIAMPVYEILHELFPVEAKDLTDGVENNKLMWVKLRHETKRRKLSSTNSLDFFRVPFTCEADHFNGMGSTAEVLEEQDEESTSSKNGQETSTRI